MCALSALIPCCCCCCCSSCLRWRSKVWSSWISGAQSRKGVQRVTESEPAVRGGQNQAEGEQKGSEGCAREHFWRHSSLVHAAGRSLQAHVWYVYDSQGLVWLLGYELECVHRKWLQWTVCTGSECPVFSCRQTDSRSARWKVTSRRLSELYVFPSQEHIILYYIGGERRILQSVSWWVFYRSLY